MFGDSLWWRDGVLYQIYPRSFADSNGDGIGDLPGITSRLGYLQWLGIDGLWLSPTMPSPNLDWGYDVSDFFGVHPELGTMGDLDTLVREAAARDIKVLLDLVPTTPAISTSGSSTPDARGHLNIATGTSGAIQNRMVPRPTTGSVSSPDLHGRLTKVPASTTSTTSSRSNRTSTGGTPKSGTHSMAS